MSSWQFCGILDASVTNEPPAKSWPLIAAVSHFQIVLARPSMSSAAATVAPTRSCCRGWVCGMADIDDRIGHQFGVVSTAHRGLAASKAQSYVTLGNKLTDFQHQS
jgi:hypothetical protein